MTNSTFAERVLQKLSNIDNELESIYETADAIKDLKLSIQKLQQETEEVFNNQIAGMDSLYNTAEQDNKKLLEDYEILFDGFENDINALKIDFIKELEDLNGQKNHYELSIQALETSKQKLDKNIESILTDYKEEIKKIDSALTSLTFTKLENSALAEKLAKEFSGLDEAIADKLSDYIAALDSKLEPTVIFHLNKLDRDIKLFQDELEKVISNSFIDKNKQLDEWINTKTSWFKSQQEASQNLIEQVKSSEITLTSRVNELSKTVSDDLNRFKEKTLSDIDVFQEQTVTKIDGKLQQLSELEQKVTPFINRSMQQVINKIEQTQTPFLERQRTLVEQLIQGQNLTEKSITDKDKEIKSLLEKDADKNKEINLLRKRIEDLEKRTPRLGWK